MAEKCLDRGRNDCKANERSSSVSNQTNRWSKVQKRLNVQSRENLDSFSLSILSEISQTESVRQRQNSKKF